METLQLLKEWEECAQGIFYGVLFIGAANIAYFYQLWRNKKKAAQKKV